MSSVSPASAAALASDDSLVIPPQSGFHVRIAEFEGPFDLLLQLISQQRLDVTIVALHAVTDEFLAYVRGRDEQ